MNLVGNFDFFLTSGFGRRMTFGTWLVRAQIAEHLTDVREESVEMLLDERKLTGFESFCGLIVHHRRSLYGYQGR